MLNHWTYGWFGQPRSNQTVQESQDPSQPPLRTSQTPRSHSKLQDQDTGTRRSGGQVADEGEGRKVGEEEISPLSADSFKTALEGNGRMGDYEQQRVRIEEPPRPRAIDSPRRNEIPSFPSIKRNPLPTRSRTPYATHAAFIEASHDHGNLPQQSSSVRPTPTVSSNTMNRLKAQLSSRSLPPTSPPLQSIPDYPRSQPDENSIHQTRRDPSLSQPSSSHLPPHFEQPQFDSTYPQPGSAHPHLDPDYPSRLASERYPRIETEKQHGFFDHQDSPSFPFPAQQTGHLPNVFHSSLHERPPSIDSEATLDETSQLSPHRSTQQSSSPTPFPDHCPPRPDSERIQFARDEEDEENRPKMSDWERSVEDEVRNRLELEKRLEGFEKGEESLAWARGRRLKDQEEERLKKQETSQSSTRSSKRTSSIGFLQELPPQPEMFLFEGLLLVPPPNFTSLSEISKLQHSHWIPYRAVLTSRTLRFLVQSDPSTRTPILVLDFDHCQSLEKPREPRDKEKLFPFMVEMENGEKRELIDLAHGRAPPTFENVTEFEVNPNNLSSAVLSRHPSSQPTTPTRTSTPRSAQIARHFDDLEKISKALGQNLQTDYNAQNDTRTVRRGKKLFRGDRQGGNSSEDWMRKHNKDLQVRVFMEEVPDNSRRNDWRFSQPPFPPASPHPQLQYGSLDRLRKPRPRSQSIGITPQEVDLARSIFEDLSKRNNAIDGRLDETVLSAEVTGKRLEGLRDSIGARVGRGEGDEIAKDWINRDLQANRKILSRQVPKVQQAVSTVKNINTPHVDPAHTGDRAPNRRKAKTRSDRVPPSKILPLDNLRKDYYLIPSDGRMADLAVPPSQVDIWRQGGQLHRGGSGKRSRGLRIWGVYDPVPSSYHRSRLKGGLEAARAAKEIAQFETTEQELAPPPPYREDITIRRRPTLRRKQETTREDEVLKRELAEELRKGFDEKVDPATRACEHGLLLS
ncbi:hypothetical protein JCM5353_007929 [Sporobolomyces roseus]